MRFEYFFRFEDLGVLELVIDRGDERRAIVGSHRIRRRPSSLTLPLIMFVSRYRHISKQGFGGV